MTLLEESPLTEDLLFSKLHKSPYIPVKFALSRVLLEEAITTFFKFLELPDSLKTHIDHKISPLLRRGDIGFKRREPEDGLYRDSKEFFHFHPVIFEKYASFLDLNPSIHEFMKKAEDIWKAAFTTFRQLMEMFDRRFPGTYQSVFDTEDVHLIVRILKYNWAQCGKYLAQPHFGAGGFTLAITESSPGLRIGTGPHDLKVISQVENHALFMISSNFKKTIPDEALLPAWHDVIQLDETQIGQFYSRWAIVAFLDAAHVRSLGRSETHRWDKTV